MLSGLQLDPPKGFKWVKSMHLHVHVRGRWSQCGSGGIGVLSLALGAVLPTAVCSCSLQPGKACAGVSVCPCRCVRRCGRASACGHLVDTQLALLWAGTGLRSINLAP